MCQKGPTALALLTTHVYTWQTVLIYQIWAVQVPLCAGAMGEGATMTKCVAAASVRTSTDWGLELAAQSACAFVSHALVQEVRAKCCCFILPIVWTPVILFEDESNCC